MALAKVGLGFPVSCAINSTTTVYANPASTVTYVRSLLIHNVATVNQVTLSVHVIANSGGAVGSTADSNRVFRLTLEPLDTYFTELAFPIILTGTNDSIRVVNSNTTAGDTLTVMLLGDKEA